MDKLKHWWSNDLPIGVKFVFLVLLANAVPAITILMSIPDKTETFFVWTVAPEINARLMGVMYANALILVGIGLFQPNWARVRRNTPLGRNHGAANAEHAVHSRRASAGHCLWLF
jgi:hypothetical protein